MNITVLFGNSEPCQTLYCRPILILFICQQTRILLVDMCFAFVNRPQGVEEINPRYAQGNHPESPEHQACGIKIASDIYRLTGRANFGNIFVKFISHKYYKNPEYKTDHSLNYKHTGITNIDIQGFPNEVLIVLTSSAG